VADEFTESFGRYRHGLFGEDLCRFLADLDGGAEDARLRRSGGRRDEERRPDGKWLVKLPEGHPELWSQLIKQVRSDLTASLLINTPADLDAERSGVIQAAGFIPARTEAIWRIPLASIPARPIHSDAHRLLPVDCCDLDRVVDLDNTIRADIPGTRAWRGTIADLSESLEGPDFDPALYLVAVHAHTGSYDGLIRVWNRRPWPRLGCVGVRVAWRRTRLPSALVFTVAGVLRNRGVTDVVTETDVRNGGSHPMASGRGITTGVMTEWERPRSCLPTNVARCARPAAAAGKPEETETGSVPVSDRTLVDRPSANHPTVRTRLDRRHRPTLPHGRLVACVSSSLRHPNSRSTSHPPARSRIGRFSVRTSPWPRSQLPQCGVQLPPCFAAWEPLL